MKFDKETVVVLAIAGIILAVWFVLYPKYEKERRAEAERIAAEAVKTRPDAMNPAVIPSAPVEPVKKAAPAAQAVKKVPVVTEKKISAVPVSLKNELIDFTIDPVTGHVDKAVLLSSQYRLADKSAPIVIGQESSVKTFDSDFFLKDVFVSSVKVAVPDKSTVSVIRTYSNGLTVTQLYTLPANSYQLGCSYTVSNPTSEAMTIPGFSISVSGLPPMKNLSGDKIYSERHNLEYARSADHEVVSLDPTAKETKFKNFASADGVEWFGTTNKYFATILFAEPKTPFSGFTPVRSYYDDKTESGNKYVVPAASAGYPAFVLVPNGSVKYQFSYYCGPKEISRFRQLPENAMNIMHISYFSWFDFLAKPLVRFLIYLKGLCGSYGLAIIILTIIVRAVFWPVTQRANNSMRRMQKIQPKLKELRERFKDNPQELNMRMMELYRQEKVNPFGGCLPILLQIPVFFALYSALDAAVELRQSSFLWCTDLAKPDLIGPQINLPFLGETGFHPLVIAMTALMLLQQKMTPTADPSQQKMMMLMPVIMLFMLYNLPSGLTLYWTVSQIFSIIQLKYGQILAKREEEASALPAKKA